MSDQDSGAGFVSLEVSTEGLKAGVWINGVPLYEQTDGEPRFVQSVINHWVIDGANTLQVYLSPAESGASRNAPSFGCKLLRGAFGMKSPPTDTLAEYQWSDTKTPLSAGDPKLVATRKIKVDHPYDRWRWQSAPKRALSSDDQDAILQLVMSLHRMLSTKNVRGFLSQVRARNDEMSRAFDLKTAAVTDDLSAALQGFFASSKWAMTPIKDPPGEVSFRPVADGRVVEVRHRDGGPILRGTDGARAFAYPVMVSLLDDAWTVIR